MLEMSRLKDELEKLKNQMEQGRLFVVSRSKPRPVPNSAPVKVMEALPSLTGLFQNRHVNLDFLPWQGGKYVKVMDLSLRSPFEMYLEKREGDENFRMIKTRLPVSEMKWKHSLSGKYLVQATFLNQVNDFLENEENNKLIEQLVEFDRLRFDLRYVRLYRIISSIEEIKAENVFSDLKVLAQLADNIEALNEFKGQNS